MRAKALHSQPDRPDSLENMSSVLLLVRGELKGKVTNSHILSALLRLLRAHCGAAPSRMPRRHCGKSAEAAIKIVK